MPLDASTRLGPYEILGPLGAGGMGEVYRARDTRLDRLVAVKVLPADSASAMALERFGREAKAIAALNHPGICAVYDVGTEPVPFLVMELLEGETLHQRLGRGAINVATIVDLGLVLADALASAHAKGIIHRDLKPANIVITPRGPKILDFGLARITESTTADAGVTVSPTLSANAPLTDAGVAVGTVAYMSPEQLRGVTLDARSDLFSLGVVLYEMATGQRAFSGATSAVTSAAILHDQPTMPRQHRPDLPPRLEHVILTMLEKDRDVRMQTAAELRAELTRLKRDLGGVRASDSASSVAPSSAPSDRSSPVSTVAAPPSSSDAQLIAGVLQRHRRAVLAVGVLLLALVAGAAYVVWRPATSGNAQGGVPITIADLTIEQLTTSGTANSPAISPDGNYVAYIEQGGGAGSLRVRQVATGSNVEAVPATPGVVLIGPGFTPDGVFVTYMRSVTPQPFELWQIPVLGGTPRRLVGPVGSRAAFSPDGTQMAYARPGSEATEVVLAGVDGSGARVLATRAFPTQFLASRGQGLAIPFTLSWSPDGTTLAVLGSRTTQDGGRQSGQVVFVDAKTGAELSTVDAGPPLIGAGIVWLDERWLVASMLDRSSAPLQLWLLSYPDGTFHRLSNDLNQYNNVSVNERRDVLVTARSAFTFGVWTSDAAATTWSQVVADTPMKGPIGFGVEWIGDDLLYVASTASGFGLMRWNATTRAAQMIAPSAGDPTVTGDGSLIAAFDYDAGEVFTIDGSGGNRVLVSSGFGPLRRLMPDGKHLVGIVMQPTPTVQLQPVDTNGTSRVIASDRVRNGIAEADGKRLAVARASASNDIVVFRGFRGAADP